ncbi:MAG: hypothetical protein EXR79_08045 [Myxococcales bacterium]|nr:hypothetical protein [Myxococcales bacterium]
MDIRQAVGAMAAGAVGCAGALGCSGATVRGPDFAVASGYANLDEDSAFAIDRTLAARELAPESEPGAAAFAGAPPRASGRLQSAAPAQRRALPLPPQPSVAPGQAASSGASIWRPAPVAAAAPTPVAAGPAAQSPPPAPDAAARTVAGDERARRRVEAAIALIGTASMEERELVGHVLRAGGHADVGLVEPFALTLWQRLGAAGQRIAESQVQPGDLAFFRDTTDLNGNGRPDDGVSMVGIAEQVEGSRVVFVGARAGKVRRLAVDPRQPTRVRDGTGAVTNTRLVRWAHRPEPLTTGECFVGYARPD